jgi:hypothetical protein
MNVQQSSELAIAPDRLRRCNVSALRASGYRNLEGTFPVCAPLAILVGENNVIDGLRTVLEPESRPAIPSLVA